MTLARQIGIVVVVVWRRLGVDDQRPFCLHFVDVPPLFVKVALMCVSFFHITASFDERW